MNVQGWQYIILLTCSKAWWIKKGRIMLLVVNRWSLPYWWPSLSHSIPGCDVLLGTPRG